MIEAMSVADNINKDTGVLNSCLPLLIKKRWIQKAKIPDSESISEKIRPEKEPLYTRTRPYKTRNNKGKWIMRNPLIPPGSLKMSHSFQ